MPEMIVKEINLIGAIKVPADDLKGVMFTRAGGTFREEILPRDLTILQTAYYDRGFVDVKIDYPLLSTSADKRFIDVSIKIEEGEVYGLGKIDFSGDLLGPKDGLRKLMTSGQGELFNRSKLSKDILTITDVYLDQGYAFANITPLAQLRREQRLVDLTFDIQKGNQVYIERIDLRGNIKTREEEIRREMQIHEGELFSSAGERRSKERLTALGLFETVEVQHKPGSDNSKVVVTVDVKEKNAALHR
jgi:outer membrane protein insertion porin family